MTSPDAGTPVLGRRAERPSRKVLPRLQVHLVTGEHVTAYFLTNSLRPVMDFVVVTNRRVLAGHSNNVRSTPPLVSVHAADLVGVRFEKSAVLRQPRCYAELRRSGGSIFLGQLLDETDEQSVRQCLGVLAGPGPRAVAARTPPPAHVPRPDETPTHDEASDDWEAMIDRLAVARVLDDGQYGYVRSVLIARAPHSLRDAEPNADSRGDET